MGHARGVTDVDALSIVVRGPRPACNLPHVVAQVAADGLQYGLVGEGPSGEVVPVVDWTRHLSLEGVRPVDRTQERFWTVWTASWCDPQAKPGGADDTGATPPLQEAAAEG